MPILQTTPLRDWMVLGGLMILIFALLLLADALRRRRLVGAEVTRKAVHLLTGVLILACPFFFLTALPLFVLAALFILVNYLALRFHFFAGIHVSTRPTWGTVYYPLSFFILLIIFWERNQTALMVGMSLLAIADVCAAMAGENAKAPIKLQLPGDQKTLQGAFAMFVSSALLIFSGLRWLGPAQNFTPAWHWLLFISVAIALLATVAEALSWRGSDNLSVPLLTAAVVAFFMQASPEAAQQFWSGELLAATVAALSFRFRFLDLGGALVTFLLGTSIFGLGGWAFSLPILAFFVLSSLLSKFSAKLKTSAHEKFQKGSRRDFGQVLANGGVAGVLVVLWHLQPEPLFYFLYLGAIAAATADTWATEIGVLSAQPPRLITSWQTVSAGTSGAISLLGLIGATLGSLVIAILGWAVQLREPEYHFGWAGAALITCGGVLAHLCDSLFGATIQAQQRCVVCAKVSEKKGACCGVERQPHSGWRWVDNDMVNGLCGLCGVIVVLLGMRMME